MSDDELRAKWIAEFGRCQAVTRRGRQCQYDSHVIGHTVCGGNDFETIDFVPGETDRCYLHRVSVLISRVSDPKCPDSTLENVLVSMEGQL